jgi:hypothetical protein
LPAGDRRPFGVRRRSACCREALPLSHAPSLCAAPGAGFRLPVLARNNRSEGCAIQMSQAQAILLPQPMRSDLVLTPEHLFAYSA